MADTNRLAGTLTLTIDGRPYSVSGEGTYRVSSAKRESLMGQDGYHGFSEMPQPGKIGFKGRDSNAMTIAAINNATNVSVTMALANGKIIIGRNMVRIGDPIEVNTEDATFPVELEGPDVQES